jgi:hypothetical protein
VAHAGAASTLTPPVIKEKFTPLPCPKQPKSTVDQEACAEHQILTTDGQINALAKSIFNVLPDNAARRRFVTWIWEYEPSVPHRVHSPG